MRCGTRALILVGLVAVAGPAVARGEGQPDDDLLQALDAIDQMSLTDLLQTATDVAGSAKLTVREAPGAVYIITRDEILASGARDLIDLLQTVPGFQFAQDVNGVTGIGFRGLWAQEGKVLLRLDGHELNELLYLNTEFGNDLPVAQLERVEIVRGPGSSNYGGMAELTVINLVTRRGKDLDGGAVTLDVGMTAQGLARTNATFALGGVSHGLELSMVGFVGDARQSTDRYDDGLGSSFSMGDNSRINPALISARLAWRDLHLAFMWRNYEITDRTGYVEALAIPGHVSFSSVYLDLGWDGHLGDDVTLAPRFTFKSEKPWNSVSTDSQLADLYYDDTARSFRGEISAGWRALSFLTANLGIEGAVDQATRNSVGQDVSNYGDPIPLEDWRTWEHGAGWAGLRLTTPYADVDLSARVDVHSVFGPSVSPRLAVGKVLGRFHYKLLLEQASKTPGFENEALNPQILQERARSYEVELGVLATDELFLQLNVGSTAISDAIVYGVDESGNETYVNLKDKLGTTAVEAELRWRGRLGFATLSYSFFTPRGLTDGGGPFSTPGQPDDLLAFAAHKVALSATFEPGGGVRVSPSLVYLSPRTAAVAVDSAGDLEKQDLPAALLINLWLDWHVPQVKALTVGVGVHNLLDSELWLAQPYQGGKPPLPTMGREWGLRLRWEG